MKTKTVLVLGAGASVPYRFPTGTQLSEQILHALSKNSGGRTRLIEVGIATEQEIEKFHAEFSQSGRNSIDAFLEHRPEYLGVGKAAIAFILLPYEQAGTVFSFDPQNWLRYMFNEIAPTFEVFNQNASLLSIVTFNYDRVVEYFLYNALKNSFGKSKEDCKAALSRFPIVHLHGRLGYLPWERDDGTIEFGGPQDQKNLGTALEQLKIIHEELKDGRDAEFMHAKGLLMESQRVFFLGFGFNRTNVERLNLISICLRRGVAIVFVECECQEHQTDYAGQNGAKFYGSPED
jgi:hypothetical protein